MKVGILTWFKAVNHGAILQTYASEQILKTNDVKPVVLNYNWEKYNNNKYIKIKNRININSIKKVAWYYRIKKLFSIKHKNFNNFIEKYLDIGKYYYEENDLDAVYIGSDMVFDISEGYNAFMHGEGVKSPYIFSYGASFGYTTFNSINKSNHFEDIRNNLSKLKEIGYRDEKTYEICKQLDINVPLKETIDPVLCYGFDKEMKEWDTGKWKDVRYLLIYAYDSTMNDRDTVNSIKEFAKRMNLKVISCGYYHKWCDICVPASPCEFIEMFKHSEYVITDTFHGSIFSLIFHKQFVTIIRNNGFKVEYLLKQSSLENRIVKDPILLSKLLCDNIIYSEYDEWLKNARNKSLEFIARNINNAREINK